MKHKTQRLIGYIMMLVLFAALPWVFSFDEDPDIKIVMSAVTVMVILFVAVAVDLMMAQD